MKQEDFASRLGDRFSLEVELPLALELAEVQSLASSGRPPEPGHREPFSCVFLGPPERPLGQGTHTLVHPALGRLAIFLVPVGPADGGLRYEAVFA